jgi:nucleotide-binding universal stress UspA family protein
VLTQVVVVVARLRREPRCGLLNPMHVDDRPVVVAFDGSAESRAAMTAAAALFRDRPLLVVSVWEHGLATATLTHPDAMGVTYPLPSVEEIATVDRIEREHAAATAEAGVQLARGAGASATALPVPDGGDVAETVGATAEQHGAAAIVVGSRGLGGVKAKLLGSTSRRLVHDSRVPVLVVRAPK